MSVILIFAFQRTQQGLCRMKESERKKQQRPNEIRFGARSAAGRMSPLSLTPNVREHRFQMHHYRNCARAPLMSWR
ncbi:hypothetical protein, partial [Paraburkholderia caffeinilytica]|uniref:hypothetical protein n=1 Tax=Paraburkholderia caffeinilytica TaxID=1761016 RepID=UPI0038BDDB95